jgi:hypothetical protein
VRLSGSFLGFGCLALSPTAAPWIEPEIADQLLRAFEPADVDDAGRDREIHARDGDQRSRNVKSALLPFGYSSPRQLMV